MILTEAGEGNFYAFFSSIEGFDPSKSQILMHDEYGVFLWVNSEEC